VSVAARREATSVSGFPALTGPAMTGIARLSATDTVRARIELAIELDLLVVGEKLPSDASIATSLNVSEITARRALESLAEDGVLSRRRGRGGGTFVADQKKAASRVAVDVFRADDAEVHRLIDLRILLESALIHHAALVATSEQIAEIESHVRAAGIANNWSEYHLADEQFHLAVARASGLDWALPHYSETLNQLYRYFIPYPIAQLRLANHDHVRIVEAIRDHDPVRAVVEISRHVSALHRTMFVGYPPIPNDN
jgi:GntR family transcriptional regulator, transcriptional repressor for pyruvate dehydrogenase complex